MEMFIDIGWGMGCIGVTSTKKKMTVTVTLVLLTAPLGSLIYAGVLYDIPYDLEIKGWNGKRSSSVLLLGNIKQCLCS